jgi:hypothetical protein
MPLPLYAPPAFRSSRSPNPFARTQPQRLRVLVDRPLLTGPIDGEAEYQGYPFHGGGSIGYPDSAAVLRSYLRHPALGVMRFTDELKEAGDVVLGEPYPAPNQDTFWFEVQNTDGASHTGIDYYGEAVEEAASFASKYGVGASEGHDGVLLYRIGAELEADQVVTAREWLLAERGRPHGQMLANLVSPAGALALIGLYLRWHQQPTVIGGAAIQWHPTTMNRSAAYTQCRHSNGGTRPGVRGTTTVPAATSRWRTSTRPF